MNIEIYNEFRGSIIGGAIGDAYGSSYEFIPKEIPNTFYLSKIQEKNREWTLTDDTFFTLATCEAITKNDFCLPENLATELLRYYKIYKIPGIGASTLKALRELEVGGHWSLVGRKGEYAAGNGAAMRISPFAFYEIYTRENIRDFCLITHNNDEAYVGALCVFLSIKNILNGKWNGENNLIDLLINEIPDTKVRDRLIKINELGNHKTITEIAKLGNDGYVVNSIPFSIFCATKVLDLGFTNVIQEIINSGGDTDTNASIFGQISGALIGIENIPNELTKKLEKVKEYKLITEIIQKMN